MTTGRMTWRVGLLAALLPAAFPAAPMAQTAFSAPEKITDSAENYRLSRNPSRQMALDSDGVLHATYWAGGEASSPAEPSFVYYRSWTRTGGWSTQEQIDDSTAGSDHLGGRHSTIAITADDTVAVFWHDGRHGSMSGGWVNNLEIYADFLPKNSSFSPTDVRITTTGTAHFGDNAYAPQPALMSNDRIAVAFYDFHFNQNVSDIFLATSGFNAAFGAVAIGDMRVTDAADRGSAGSFVLPSLAVDADDTRHLTWIVETTGDLYYAEVPDGTRAAAPVLLGAGVGDFFDPPRIAAAPNGDVWIANADEQTVGGENIVLRRLLAGQAAFDAPIIVTSSPARQYAPDIVITPDGMVHLLWIDERNGTHVGYGVFDPSSGLLLEEFPITQTAGPYARPDLLVGADGSLYAMWEEQAGVLPGGDLWFAFTTQPASATGWELYF